jgi:hypothetical protein
MPIACLQGTKRVAASSHITAHRQLLTTNAIGNNVENYINPPCLTHLQLFRINTTNFQKVNCEMILGHGLAFK